jgi:hypothetical protein
VLVSRVKEPQMIVEEQAFVIPWQHQKYLNFWTEFLQYMSKLISEQLKSKLMVEQFKKDNFYNDFRKVSIEISDHYPFLHPDKGDVKVLPGKFTLTRVLPHPTFLQGMTMVINKVLRRVSSRRFRKLDIETVINEVTALTQKNDIQQTQLDPQKLVFQIFKGFV